MDKRELCMNGPRMHKRVAFQLLALVFLLLAPCAFGQAAASPTAEAGAKNKAATVRLDVEEVSIDLVVHDKQHRSILDLKPGDLSIADNGTPVKLNNLHLVSGESAKGYLLTLVFDPMTGAAAHNAADIANKVIAMLPRKGFEVAVYLLGSRLNLVQGFTGDARAMRDAVEVATQLSEKQQNEVITAAETRLLAVVKTGVDTSGRMISVRDRALAQVQLTSMEGSQRIVRDEHALPSLAGLLALARGEQELEERKTVIYFSLNGQLNQDANAMVKTILTAAQRANVSMYTVDMTGIGASARDQLMTMSAIGPIAGHNPEPLTTSPMAALLSPAQQASAPKVQPADAFGSGGGMMIATNTLAMEAGGIGNGVANSSPLGALAALTGGAYIDGQDSVKKPLQQMLQDMTTYYQASYVPPEQEYDGSFRPITVKSLRSGVFVRAKAGYFALPSGGGIGIRPFETPLMKILSEPQLPTEQSFKAAVLRLGEMADGNTNSLVVELPLSGVEMREDTAAQQYSAHLSIVAQIKDQYGTVVDHFAEDIPRHGALDTMQDAKAEFVTLQWPFIAIPGDYTLEAAVLDRNSGAAGAQRVHFKISEPPKGPSLSDGVLVRKMTKLTTDTDLQEPLSYEEAKVTPNLTGKVTLDEDSIMLFFVLHPDPKISEAPRLEMDILRDGSPAGHAPLNYKPGTGAIPFLAMLRTKTLSPGLYDITARMTQGRKKAESTISFSVPGNRPAGTALVEGDAALRQELQPRKSRQLVFTVPETPLPPPSWQEFDSILADAGQHALAYRESLPDLLCVKVTDRSVDANNSNNWKHKDSIAEMLRYHDKAEAWTALQVDGKPAIGKVERESQSAGEFGEVLKAIFQPSSKADIKWKEAQLLGKETIHVFNYKVGLANSDFQIDGAEGARVTVGFYGQVFIDATTHNIRRVTLTTSSLGKDPAVHPASITVDYDTVAIGGQSYLLPVAGEVRLKTGEHTTTMRQMDFRDYKPYGSNVTIMGENEAGKP
jgi:VWFA-related protein